ncbi:MAG TPA: ribosome silencing factor [Anaeromyxobacteraceae bacterium]|nr:ribosome silencing factor [Anaeromyxobacteraceae bacterium]
MATKKKAPTRKSFVKKGPAKSAFAKKGPAKSAFARKGPAKKGPRSGSPKGVFKGGYKKGPAKGVPAGRKTQDGKAPVRKATAPRAAPRPAPVADRPDPSRPLALAIAKAGLDKKAEEVLLLDVRGLTSYADYFVVMTADSDRQAGAIADHVESEMKDAGVTKVGVEGYESGRWILVDYGDVVAHVMNKEAREFYDIEGLWADAKRTTISD